ncbi:thermonuclease family protein [Streptomyces sp. NPDC003023]|uniref:thermonuclease family protein n=1 Tax=Streptomyces sp. NPDC003023 TaxID=3364675 RepID=UPI00367AA3D8
MIDPVQVLWSPEGVTMPSLGARALTDVHDGDTPSIRMPIRMLSVDTPEVTAGTAERAAIIDQKFVELARWIREGVAPITPGLAEFLIGKLDSGRAGTLQFQQGTAASDFAKRNIETRLARPNGTPRNLFIRITDTAFDDNHRLLAYIAPSYSRQELATMDLQQRSTFNLDLVRAGWSAPFIIYPSIPGERDLPLMLAAAETAVAEKRGIWADPDLLLAYEYRAVEKLHSVTKKKTEGSPLTAVQELSWRQRYCADLRTRELHGPEDYFLVDPVYRLWLWPQDVQEAVGRLNLWPSARLGGAD